MRYGVFMAIRIHRSLQKCIIAYGVITQKPETYLSTISSQFYYLTISIFCSPAKFYFSVLKIQITCVICLLKQLTPYTFITSACLDNFHPQALTMWDTGFCALVVLRIFLWFWLFSCNFYIFPLHFNFTFLKRSIAYAAYQCAFSFDNCSSVITWSVCHIIINYRLSTISFTFQYIPQLLISMCLICVQPCYTLWHDCKCRCNLAVTYSYLHWVTVLPSVYCLFFRL